jgi:hypothetical protein
MRIIFTVLLLSALASCPRTGEAQNSCSTICTKIGNTSYCTTSCY